MLLKGIFSLYYVFSFFHKINCVLKNLNRLIFFSNFSMKNFPKKTWNFILDHNALISVFRFLICYHNFFIIYRKNDLGEFCGCILWRKTQLKFSKNLSGNSIVKNVTMNAHVKVISINIWRAKSIIQQIQQKYNRIFSILVNVVRVITIVLLYSITRNRVLTQKKQ